MDPNSKDSHTCAPEGTQAALGDPAPQPDAALRPRVEYSLDDLLARITPENLHEETDWGVSVGAERSDL